LEDLMVVVSNSVREISFDVPYKTRKAIMGGPKLAGKAVYTECGTNIGFLNMAGAWVHQGVGLSGFQDTEMLLGILEVSTSVHKIILKSDPRSR
jgi:hypothetical protein